MARIMESSARRVGTARAMSTARVLRKARTRGRKAKARDQEKRKGQHPTRASQATAGHVASGTIRRASAGKVTSKEWEEVPSSSASSVPPSTVTTTTAAKTTAAIQEVVSGEDEPGWICGMASGSVVAATTDRDDVWDALVLDSGSVSTACPYAWCSDIERQGESVSARLTTA